MSAPYSYREVDGTVVWQGPPPKKTIDTPPEAHGTLAPEMRAYLVERRRALLTELKSLDRLLSLTTK